MQRLSLLETPLTGMNLIEASAGTGKTYTITGLYVRLILEQGLTVDQILVVTYTKAATAELKERLRSRLVELKRDYKKRGDDPLCRALLIDHPECDIRIKRLNLAILSFDLAAVFTIHGFCQRVLSQSAFESSMPFQTELLLDERRLVQEIVDDFWRIQIQDIPAGLQTYLLNKGFSPDQLAEMMQGKFNKPYLTIRGTVMPVGLDRLESAFNTIFNEVRQTWLSTRAEVISLLKESDGLNRSKYRLDSIEKWGIAMDLFLQSRPGPRFKELEKFSASTLAVSLKKSGEAPQHQLFNQCDQLLPALDALEQSYDQARVFLLEALLHSLNEELPKRKQQQRVQSYDDLLLNLDRALHSAQADQLISAVRNTYRAALIDEFQDTDPIQYESFRKLFRFESGSLFLVGDPKQAIYSFRGADIFAYLRARGDAGACYSLDVNWRSVPSLIKAVNTLFDQQHGGFLFPQIPFNASLPAEKPHQQLVSDDEASADLTVGFVPGKPSKEHASAVVVDWTADEIARLVLSGRDGKTQIGDRSLVGGDIAVLVRSHRQGEAVKRALLIRGIYSVQRSQQDVFKSNEAVEIERLLLAIQTPQHEGLIFAALATNMLGVSGDEIARLADDEVGFSIHLELFFWLHQMWLQDGFMRMFRYLLREQQIVERILALSDGERRLTNILHLAELLHQQERESAVGMEALCSWFNQLRCSEWAEDERGQLRLESDDNLVQIVTIHKSKGLQYPVVFAPFVWDGGVRKVGAGEPCSFHDPDQDYRAVLDFGSPAWGEAMETGRNEALAESLRLLYVALTRAQYRCYITWGQINGAGESPMAWLLHPPAGDISENQIEQLATHFKTLSEDDLFNRLQQWTDGLDGDARIQVISDIDTIDLLSASPQAAHQQAFDFDSLQARSLDRKLSRGRSVTSFSALAAGHEHFERPDHDGLSVMLPDEPEVLPIRNPFSFPRGANPGSCLHAIFENLDFVAHSELELQQLVEQQLTLYGIDTLWKEVVCQLVRDSLSTELEPNSGLTLGRLERSQCLVEMEFNYPIDHLKATELSSILMKHGVNCNEEMEQAITRLSFRDCQGYLKGFIDLIFEFEGRYYLLDYKSNWLGDQQSDYDPINLQSAIAREGYFLQYLLYCLALHRYLGQRLTDYDYDTHFGAVYYLFLRGMSPAEGSRYGIFRDRPSIELISALDGYFSQAGSVA
ncbi:MAG: exodeoxyribonuclease V subunit beta [Sedimenticola sp.]|nr:exodeoxyribonuclease V subunit beta [Sedimenticola sp.]